ncbi:MAG: Gfo/Idh/MocA family oxidoreductase, partial [Oscillospiraceae bacterium]
MSKVYGLVLIGCGHIGAVHLEDIYFRENIRLIGVVDTNENVAQMFMKKYGAQSYSTSYKQYLDDENVDIVIIATYVSTHLKILKDCTEKGKHVLCEKPIAGNYKDALNFVECVKNAKSKVLIGHILRHNESYHKIAAMIEEDLIGKPIVMRMVQNHHTMNWDRYKKLLEDCSPIVDCGVHYVDVMQWFTKAKVVSVSGMGARLDYDIDEKNYNYGMIQAKLSDGSIAYYEAGWSNSTASENVKEFIGPKGRIKLVLSAERSTHKE